MAAHFGTPIAPPSSKAAGGFKPNQALPTKAVPAMAPSQEHVRKGSHFALLPSSIRSAKCLNIAVESRPTALESTPCKNDKSHSQWPKMLERPMKVVTISRPGASIATNAIRAPNATELKYDSRRQTMIKRISRGRV